MNKLEKIMAGTGFIGAVLVGAVLTFQGCKERPLFKDYKPAEYQEKRRILNDLIYYRNEKDRNSSNIEIKMVYPNDSKN